jgi:ribosome biogenesis GTPase
MIEFDLEALRSVGLTPAVLQSAAGLGSEAVPPCRLQRVTEIHRESVRLHDGHDERSARALPRLERSLAERDQSLSVGDWVLAALDAHGQTWVHERVPPVSHLARRDAQGRSRPLVSNVDTALLVMGLDDDFNPRRTERYLALVQGSGVMPVVVLTKADLMSDAQRDERIDTLRERVPSSVEVLAVDATAAPTARRLAPWLAAGQTLVLLGSSGAGKSTLTNTLLGAAVQSTGAVRVHDSRGKHTTTSRSLFRLPQGACVIDTPGVRTLRPDIDEASLAASFDDIATLASRCRYRDCAHGDEPGCAVRDGVDADRLRNYHKLVREARRDTMSALERQRQVGEWKARSKAVRAYMKVKGRPG